MFLVYVNGRLLILMKSWLKLSQQPRHIEYICIVYQNVSATQALLRSVEQYRVNMKSSQNAKQYKWPFCPFINEIEFNLNVVGANVVRAHAQFPCEGRRSGH